MISGRSELPIAGGFQAEGGGALGGNDEEGR